MSQAWVSLVALSFVDPVRSSTPDAAPQGSSPPARYRVIEQLGQGGMGVVYRARDAVTGQELALKRLRVHGGQRESQDTIDASERSAHSAVAMLFQREFHTLAQLKHPNIIEVHDYGVDAEGPFYTMELLAGSDLHALAPMPWQRACALLRDVASALTLLHARRFLHRDISPRNVRCVADGRAKLMDFGAMTPMGVEPVLAGTPPFVPPEALARQSLDARADVFALGALAYWMLTGRHAFPSRTLRDVRDAWRSTPALPSSYARDVPEALDALVMRMLSLDRQGRPSSAVELVERLSALAGLELHASAETPTSAYLTTPNLVGRAADLLSVRRRIVHALSGHGASVLVSGPAGVGRTRFLDVCVLEAKLAGALVLRIGRAEAGSGPYGGARALLEQLAQLTSARERGSLPPQAGAALQAGAREPSDPSARADCQAALLAYLTRIAKSRLLALAVDDVHALDEPTSALLAALATRVERRRLVLLTACDASAAAGAGAALRVLRDASHELPLLPLAPHETDELLRSVLGDVPNVTQLAARIHALSGGLPRACMELVQHLVDGGVLAYRAGGFVLPAELPDGALPSSLQAALRVRIAGLSANGRELGAWLALAGEEPLAISECIALSGGEHDPAPVYLAVNELLAARMIYLEGERVRLAQDYVPAFESMLASDQRARLHEGLAALLARDPFRCVRAAEHWLAAQQPDHAVEALLRYVRDPDTQRAWFSDYLPVLEAGIEASRACGRPAADTFTLRYAAARAITTYLEPGDRERLLALAHELCELAGLDCYEQLGDEPDPRRRVGRAIEQAAARHAAKPERERTLAPPEAIRAFVLYHGLLASYAGNTLDVELLHRIPSLAPFSVLAPGLAFMDKIVRATRDLRGERIRTGRALLTECYDELAAPGALGLDEPRRLATRARLRCAIARGSAAVGLPEAMEHADALIDDPDQRINAWRVRYIVHLYQPDPERAQQCRREIELLQLQGGPRQYADGGTLESELVAHARSDDLLGLRRIRPELARMVNKHPGYVPWLEIADGEIERICGHPERALVYHLAALEHAAPGMHIAWPQAAGFALDALLQLGRLEEVLARGREWLAIGERAGVDAVAMIQLPMCIADALLGYGGRALEQCDRIVRASEEHKTRGLYLGLGYEVRARIAIVAGDAEAFRDAFATCAEAYGASKGSPLGARLERLTTEARRARLHGVSDEPVDAGRVTVARVQQELAAQLVPAERAAQALRLVLEASGAIAGFLYGVRAAEIEALADNAPDRDARPEIEAMLRNSMLGDNEQERTVALTQAEQDAASQVGTATAVTDALGLRYYPFALVGSHDDGHRPLLAAVVALAFPDGRCGTLAQATASAIGAELLAHRDVTGLTLL